MQAKSLARRYRRRSIEKALLVFGSVFVLERSDVVADLENAWR